MGKSKHQEAQKFSIVHQSRYFRDKVKSEFKTVRGIHLIDIVDRKISGKFLTKVLQYHDHLTKRVIHHYSEKHNETILQFEIHSFI